MTMPRGWKSPQAKQTEETLDARLRKMYNSNTTEIELKKWMIERTAYLVQAYKDTLASQKEKFDTFKEEWTENIFHYRNSFLAVISSILTGGIGIASLITIVGQYLIPIIFVGILSASISYIFFTIWKSSGLHQLNQIEMAFLTTTESLNAVDGFVAAGSFDLDILTSRQLYVIGQIKLSNSS